MGVEQGAGNVIEAGLDKLALAGFRTLIHRRHDAEGGGDAGGDIDNRDTEAQGAALRRAVDAHQPGLRLYDGVIAGQAAIGAIGPEAGNPAMDQLREFG